MHLSLAAVGSYLYSPVPGTFSEHFPLSVGLPHESVDRGDFQFLQRPTEKWWYNDSKRYSDRHINTVS